MSEWEWVWKCRKKMSLNLCLLLFDIFNICLEFKRKRKLRDRELQVFGVYVVCNIIDYLLRKEEV